MYPPWWPGTILNWTPLLGLEEESSPASATFQRRILSTEALARYQNPKHISQRTSSPGDVPTVWERYHARHNTRAGGIAQRLEHPRRIGRARRSENTHIPDVYSSITSPCVDMCAIG